MNLGSSENTTTCWGWYDLPQADGTRCHGGTPIRTETAGGQVVLDRRRISESTYIQDAGVVVAGVYHMW